MDAISQFRDAIQSTGLVPPDVIVPDVLYRFPGLDKSPSNTAGRCKLFADGLGGWFQDYSTGLSENWQAARATPYSPAEREAFMRQVSPEPEPGAWQYERDYSTDLEGL